MVVGASRHMGHHAFRGVNHAGAILDLEALNGIRIIAGPKLGHIIKDTKVEPATATAAALKEDVGEPLCQPVHQIVHTQHIPVGVFLLPMGGQKGRAVVSQVAVHIPLDIGNIIFRQNGSDLFVDIVHDLGPRHIQHQLPAAFDGCKVITVDGPVGMGSIQVAIGADHLRLHPDAEIHAVFVAGINNGFQSIGEFPLVHIPVTQGGIVPVTMAEPAIVQHQHIDAQVFGVLCELTQLFLRDIEINSFPTVDDNGVAHTAIGRLTQLTAANLMKILAHAVKALVGEGQKRFRGHELRPRCKLP